MPRSATESSVVPDATCCRSLEANSACSRLIGQANWSQAAMSRAEAVLAAVNDEAAIRAAARTQVPRPGFHKNNGGSLCSVQARKARVAASHPIYAQI